MKTIVVFLLSFFFTMTIYAQKDGGEMIGFGCGYAGSLTPAVQDMVQHLKERDFQSIREDLYCAEAAHQFLAVVVLEHLFEEEMLILTEKESNQISQIKQSGDQVSVCSGCTYWDKVSLNDLLNSNKGHFITNSAQHWVAATLANL